MTIGAAQAHPSLALIKYWGKDSRKDNTPATTSLALTLEGLSSKTQVQAWDRDEVWVGGQLQEISRYQDFFAGLRNELDLPPGLKVQSENNFPTAAGLASSSSGFAALAGAALALTGRSLDPTLVSRLARLGSGSATRSVYGGFTRFSAGALEAQALFPQDHWPDLRVLIVKVRETAKEISSRKAMESSRLTSPYYSAWVDTSPGVVDRALEAIQCRDLETLGPWIQQSYLRMFSTMFTAQPPVIYWKSESLDLIHLCAELRAQGLQAWETMDAGPQVKIFCLEKDLNQIQTQVQHRFPQLSTLTAGPGPGIRIWQEDRP